MNVAASVEAEPSVRRVELFAYRTSGVAVALPSCTWVVDALKKPSTESELFRITRFAEPARTPEMIELNVVASLPPTRSAGAVVLVVVELIRLTFENVLAAFNNGTLADNEPSGIVVQAPSPRQNVVALALVPPLRLAGARLPVTPVDKLISGKSALTSARSATAPLEPFGEANTRFCV